MQQEKGISRNILDLIQLKDTAHTNQPVNDFREHPSDQLKLRKLEVGDGVREAERDEQGATERVGRAESCRLRETLQHRSGHKSEATHVGPVGPALNLIGCRESVCVWIYIMSTHYMYDCNAAFSPLGEIFQL